MGTLILRPKQFFLPVWPRIAVGRLKFHMWHTPPPPYSLEPLKVWSKLGINKGTLLLRPLYFFVPTVNLFAVGFLELHTWQSFPLQHNGCKFHPNRIVTKLLYSSGRNSLSSLCPQALQRGDWNVSHPHMRHKECKFGGNRAVKKCTLLKWPKKIFRPYLAWHFSGVM
jgi:hypothetical protein